MHTVRTCKLPKAQYDTKVTYTHVHLLLSKSIGRYTLWLVPFLLTSWARAWSPRQHTTVMPQAKMSAAKVQRNKKGGLVERANLH